MQAHQMLETEIAKQTLNMAETEVEELQLDQLGLKGELDEKSKVLLEKYTNLNFLTLNDCGLSSLKNFPELPNLIRLELIDNCLPASELARLTSLPNLQFLFVGGEDNQIEKVSDLLALAPLENLYHIDISGTPLSKQDGYYKDIFKALPKMEVVDGMDEEGFLVDMDDPDSSLIQDDEEEDEEEDEDDEEYLSSEEEEEEPEDMPQKRLK